MKDRGSISKSVVFFPYATDEAGSHDFLGISEGGARLHRAIISSEAGDEIGH
jgi:hypothetical protein